MDRSRFAYICKITESKIIEKQVCVDVKYGKVDEKRVVWQKVGDM